MANQIITVEFEFPRSNGCKGTGFAEYHDTTKEAALERFNRWCAENRTGRGYRATRLTVEGVRDG